MEHEDRGRFGQVGDAEHLWTNCQESLRTQVSDAVWRSTFQDIAGVGVDDGSLHLAVPSTMVRDRVEGRYLSLVEDIVRDGLGTTYEEEDLTENELVQYFKPFDLVTDEMECGFLMDPGFTSRSIHYKRAGAPHLYDLDIDMKGYLELVVATGGFFHWPKVLVDIQEGTESAETEQFREYMPRIFSGFTWRAFVAQYTGLRIG